MLRYARPTRPTHEPLPLNSEFINANALTKIQIVLKFAERVRMISVTMTRRQRVPNDGRRPTLFTPTHLFKTQETSSPLPDLIAKYRLTPREVDVARLLAEGESNQRIADRLHLSIHTVQHHTENVLRKLGINRRAAVAAKIS